MHRGRDLDAAGITSASLRAGFIEARRLNALHGKTFYLATLLLPAASRPYVHALYGFARYADDIVDTAPVAQAEPVFRRWSTQVLAELKAGTSDQPLVRAVIATMRRYELPISYFVDFLASMSADLSVRRYLDDDALDSYMWGSAAVIGLQMLPILGRRDESVHWEELESYAIELGRAFQLTNFIRDIGEDLDRDRIYLPQQSMRRYGVDDQHLLRRHVDDPIRNLLAHEIARARAMYAGAQAGIELVHPDAVGCLRAAATLYSQILTEIERADYDVFSGRISVGLGTRLRVAAPLLAYQSVHRRHRRRPTSSR